MGRLRARRGRGGMVGALADWFAVTALFRHPLGLQIPHTAIIPNKKDVLGNSLGDFVGANFLSEDVVRDKLRRVETSRRVGEWLARPENAERVTAEVATVVRGAVTVLRDEDVAGRHGTVVVRRSSTRSGGLRWAGCSAGADRRCALPLVDLVWTGRTNGFARTTTRCCGWSSGSGSAWSPRFVDDDARGQGVRRGVVVRVGGEDGCQPSPCGWRWTVPRRVRAGSAGRPRDDGAGRDGQAATGRNTPRSARSSTRRGPRRRRCCWPRPRTRRGSCEGVLRGVGRVRRRLAGRPALAREGRQLGREGRRRTW